jgi:cytochrome c
LIAGTAARPARQPAAGDPAKGQKVSWLPGLPRVIQPQNRVGPSLQGLIGRKAGRSRASSTPTQQDSGVFWDEATLDQYLTDPKAYMPATRWPSPPEEAGGAGGRDRLPEAGERDVGQGITHRLRPGWFSAR